MLASRAAFVRRAAVAAVLLHVTEAAQRFLARGRGGPSARGEVLHFRVHVEAELLVEVGVDVARPEAQVPAPRRDMHRQAGCRSEEHTSELQSQSNLVCRLLLEKKKKKTEQ